MAGLPGGSISGEQGQPPTNKPSETSVKGSSWWKDLLRREKKRTKNRKGAKRMRDQVEKVPLGFLPMSMGRLILGWDAIETRKDTRDAYRKGIDRKGTP